MNWNFVNYNCEERVGFITLNRPEKRNALNALFISELKEAFKRAEKDANCKVIVFLIYHLRLDTHTHNVAFEFNPHLKIENTIRNYIEEIENI